MKKLVLLLGFVAVMSSHVAHANTVQEISFEVYPFVGSLGSNAETLETQIVEQASKVCGSIANVAVIAEVQIENQKTSVLATMINPEGKPGGRNGKAILTFLYPRTAGTATVTCK